MLRDLNKGLTKKKRLMNIPESGQIFRSFGFFSGDGLSGCSIWECLPVAVVIALRQTQQRQ